MEIVYRCLQCGNNVSPEEGKDIECNSCNTATLLVLVTEKNKNKLPFPKKPIGRVEVDTDDPASNCQCTAGRCPCGKFVAHPASEAWDPDNPHLFPNEIENANKDSSS